MKNGIYAPQPRASVPAIGPWIPTAVLHLGVLALAVGLCFLVLPPPLSLGFGLLLAIGAILVPDLVPRWWLLLLLGLGQVWREPSVTDPVFYLLLAGVHLLYVLDSPGRLLPWMGRMQVRALVRPLRRFVLIQLAVQPVAMAALLAFVHHPVALPGLSILSAAALGVVAIVLARQLRQADPPPSASRPKDQVGAG